MGDVSEMMLDGTLCATCGTFIDRGDEEEPGFPVDCEECCHEAGQ